MKVRTGYVSNSSSSSFCIVGTVLRDDCFDMDVLNKFLGQKQIEKNYDEYRIKNMSIWEKLSELYDIHDIDFHRGIEEYSSDDYIVGLGIGRIQDNQTFGDFKKKVLEQLKAIGFTGDVEHIAIHIDGGYEG